MLEMVLEMNALKMCGRTSATQHILYTASYHLLPSRLSVKMIVTHRNSLVGMIASHDIQVLCEKSKKCMKVRLLCSVALLK